MLELFDEMADSQDRADVRDVLALLLIRRRVLRLEETQRDEHEREMLIVYCPRRETDYKVPVVMPTAMGDAN